jgi:hypothetical protein
MSRSPTSGRMAQHGIADVIGAGSGSLTRT